MEPCEKCLDQETKKQRTPPHSGLRVVDSKSFAGGIYAGPSRHIYTCVICGSVIVRDDKKKSLPFWKIQRQAK